MLAINKSIYAANLHILKQKKRFYVFCLFSHRHEVCDNCIKIGHNGFLSHATSSMPPLPYKWLITR